MSKYRARRCPHCGYYQAYIIGKPFPNHSETPITGFCLNCDHRLPVIGCISGRQKAKLHRKRPPLRLARVNDLGDRMSREQHADRDAALRRAFAFANYSRHLRVIGQQLEAERWQIFNLGCTEDGYEVMGRAVPDRDSGRAIFSLGKQHFQKLWNSLVPSNDTAKRSDEPQRQERARFSIDDLEARDRMERGRRRNSAGQTNGHTTSQLLRTIGLLVAQKNQRLLAISWQELSICIVVETGEGRKEVDVFRPDNLYDSWVRYYLKRDNVASSDQSR